MKRAITAAVALLAAVLVAVAGEAQKDEVEVQGKIGCGHCTYHQGEHCAVGLKTEKGEIYLLTKASDELMEARFGGDQLKVKGTVTEKDGVKYVEPSSAELVK